MVVVTQDLGKALTGELTQLVGLGSLEGNPQNSGCPLESY